MKCDLTKEQNSALLQIWERTTEPPSDQFGTHKYRDFQHFKDNVSAAFNDGCVMIGWQGMMLGIEANGHTHS
jgi:hypothetical protein